LLWRAADRVGLDGSVSPEQVDAVAASLDDVDLDALAADFYDRAFALDPRIATMFTGDPIVQRHRFGVELRRIATGIRDFDEFRSHAAALPENVHADPTHALDAEGKERPRAGSGIEAACCVAKERKPTNCCVRGAAGKAKKCLLPFCCGEAGIAPIRSWNNSFCNR